MFPEWGEIPFLLTEEKMKKSIVKIEVATQDKNGVTRQDIAIHGPGRDWANLVAWALSDAGVPGGDLVHLCIINTDGSCSYEFFNW
jgi:hypothetical protein